ncbi:hypothetical protein NRI_0057 [Neorickettsia risticii str. Illinois]|uniref:Uncharacterized protein n=1 Tax=Neorickettsia risticii (strain Illinois) TaxID=434131 RepID=C6V3T9_NEORI|nr:hypothetical protein NRI_0057 [Neorickettsia risticii str. Illinois]
MFTSLTRFSSIKGLTALSTTLEANTSLSESLPSRLKKPFGIRPRAYDLAKKFVTSARPDKSEVFLEAALSF